MSSNNHSALIIKVLDDEIAPLFASEGFVKSGNLFYKIDDGIVKSVQLEKSRWNTRFFSAFWLTFDIHAGNFPKDKKLTYKKILEEGSPAIHKRLGSIWGQDAHQYEITDSTDFSHVASSVVKDLRTHLLPFFGRFSNIDDVLVFLDEENIRLGKPYYSFAMATILAKAGRKNESRKRLFESDAAPEIKDKFIKNYGLED